MKPGLLLIVPLSVALWGVLSVGCRTPAPFGATQRGSLAQAIITDWSKSSKLTAAAMIEKYGPPDAIALGGLGWKDKGPWKKIIVRDRTEILVSAQGTADSLEQTVAYHVPEDKRPELEAFGDKVRVSQDGTSMSARSDAEALNFLALNLADGIGRGAIDAAQARDSYRRAVALSRAGKSSPLMQRLLFPPSP
ncbi:MAG: hypothetical protein PHS14_04185 [Elusimicrobia bacterium]|nr:hypothetical protein [Elusimicrobiota bacterium]